MDIFKHEPIDLEGPAFRLLRLFKGSEADIECELFQAWLHGDSAISYEALSYTWGGTEMSASVKINGRTLHVTENLYLALQYLRSQETDRILWVDAICIDQCNHRERGHQVQQMGNIYSQADRVVIWLGPATHDINVLMNSLKQLEEESIKYACKDWSLTDKRWVDLWSSLHPFLMSQHWGLEVRQRAGLELLLGRPWFKRVWILQEVANAKRAVVCSGTKSVSARIFALAPLLMNTTPEPHCQAVLDIMPGPSRKYSWWSQKRDLYTLLRKFKSSKASDPRDMIYALLGISSDAHSTNRLRADYTKDLQQVVVDTASFFFGRSDFTFHTVPELLQHGTSLNNKYLIKVAKSQNASNVAHFLMWRGDEVKVTAEVVRAAAENTENGREVMDFLLQKRGSEVKVTERIVKAAARNTGSGKEVMNFLHKQRGEEVVRAAAQSGKEAMEFLLQQRGSKVKITEEVVKAAARSLVEGQEVIDLLLQQQPKAWEITEGLVTELTKSFNTSSIEILLRKRGSEIRVTEEVVKAAAGNTQSGKEIMDLLLQQRGSEIKVTEEVVKGRQVMDLLLQRRGS
ncbi:HET-domain-containing protein [Lindgomyces ingoldianus]|uniref:HET-domain-containing protein n=1 Tax=Lindgomyces ingoldianus TaxID=673940 RepID=A0ACB6QD13_9PLEO|nr:HET-domain-containing protein [Lindgomyces ingoldianus]KAF2464838.1 HET-domain-containing protein [Lindgomyces ingoldianus]